nr:MAG TPA: Repressor protein CI [Caudoviricetes sp.]
MATFAERLKSLRREKSWSQQRLADELELSKSSVNMYERGEREPGFETMEAIADLFNVDMNYLYGRTDIKIADPIVLDHSAAPAPRPIPKGFEPMPKMKKIPLVGSIACGTPILAQQNIDGHVDAPEDIRCDFALRCKGDSMIGAGIHDGDAVYIHIQPEVENGEIAAVRIGEEATLKRVYYDGTTLTLMPYNNAYAPMVYTGPQLEDVHIEGKAVGYTHWFD